MSYAFRSVGAVATGTGALSPGAPAGKQVGDLLLLSLESRDNTQTAPGPSGWTLVSPTTPVGWNYLYARIADGTSADTPTGLTYTGSPHAQAQIAAFSGGGFSLATIVTNSVSQNLPGGQTSILYSAGLTITPSNCLVIAVGTKNKTATSNGTTINNLTGFTKIDSNVNAGTDISQWWGYQIQTTATNIAASLTQTLTGTTETLQYTSLLVALQSTLDLPATNFTYAYTMEAATLSTTNSGFNTLSAAPLSFSYTLASSNSQMQLDGPGVTYSYSLSDAQLVQVSANNTLAAGFFTYSASPLPVTLTYFVPTPPAPGTFPSVIGMILRTAEQTLEDAGALIPSELGYFGTWPITVITVQSTFPPGSEMQTGVVVAQNPLPGSVIVANAPITLTMTEYPIGFSYPGTNLTSS
jgi:PASTA domain